MVTGTQLLPGGKEDSAHDGGFTGEVLEALIQHDGMQQGYSVVLQAGAGKRSQQRRLWNTDQKDIPTAQGTKPPLPWLCDTCVPDTGCNIAFPMLQTQGAGAGSPCLAARNSCPT